MKVNIEVEISDIDLNHAYYVITHALYYSEDITQDEYDLIENIISQLKKQTK